MDKNCSDVKQKLHNMVSALTRQKQLTLFSASFAWGVKKKKKFEISFAE